MKTAALYGFVFVGALLLFGYEPMVGRMLLPRFGGAFHVWTSALMFFQVALFIAYLYAHVLAPRIGRWHLAVVLAPLAVLPPSLGTPDPTQDVLQVLVAHAALPFGVLATTAVVAQRWLAASGREPYALYAISNLGSLGALLGYAFVVEPLVGLELQRWLWAIGYVLYVALALIAQRAVPASQAPIAGGVPLGRLAYWVLLSAAPSALLMAITNAIALDAGSVPIVWVVPLAIYLASFVVAFANPRPGETTRVPRAVLRLWPHIAAVGLYFFSGGTDGSWMDILIHLTVLAFVCLAAHAELHRTRPAADRLTLFYLTLAFGGGLGGALVALLAPRSFDLLYEYPLAVVAVALTLGVGRRAELLEWLRRGPRFAIALSALLVVVIVGKIAHASWSDGDRSEELARSRSFYGLYRVTRHASGGATVRDLISGSTRHGRQREGDRTPLSYYHREGPLGDTLTLVASPRRIGVVGLGVGAAAGHLEPGDRIRFFEIDAEVERLARRYFTYLDPAHEVVIGDARIALSRERGPGYDLLLVDAFSGDAIPTHLLTVEAIRGYFARLAPNGVLLLHVSNRYYDLRPVLAANADALELSGAAKARPGPVAVDEDRSQYVVLARRRERIEALLREHGWTDLARIARGRVWTDDRVSTLEALSL